MSIFKIQAPDGRTVTLEGPSPPSDLELDEIFAGLPPVEKPPAPTFEEPQVADPTAPIGTTAVPMGAPEPEPQLPQLQQAPPEEPSGMVKRRVPGTIVPVEGMVEEEPFKEIKESVKAGARGIASSLKAGQAAAGEEFVAREMPRKGEQIDELLAMDPEQITPEQQTQLQRLLKEEARILDIKQKKIPERKEVSKRLAEKDEATEQRIAEQSKYISGGEEAGVGNAFSNLVADPLRYANSLLNVTANTAPFQLQSLLPGGQGLMVVSESGRWNKDVEEELEGAGLPTDLAIEPRQKMANSFGLLSGVTEYFQGRAMLSPIKAMRKIPGVKTLISKSLKSFKGKVGAAAMGTVFAALSEGGEEWTQAKEESLTKAAYYLRAAEETDDPDISAKLGGLANNAIKKFWSSDKREFIIGTLVGGLMGASGTVGGVIKQEGDVSQKRAEIAEGVNQLIEKPAETAIQEAPEAQETAPAEEATGLPIEPKSYQQIRQETLKGGKIKLKDLNAKIKVVSDQIKRTPKGKEQKALVRERDELRKERFNLINAPSEAVLEAIDEQMDQVSTPEQANALIEAISQEIKREDVTRGQEEVQQLHKKLKEAKDLQKVMGVELAPALTPEEEVIVTEEAREEFAEKDLPFAEPPKEKTPTDILEPVEDKPVPGDIYTPKPKTEEEVEVTTEERRTQVANILTNQFIEKGKTKEEAQAEADEFVAGLDDNQTGIFHDTMTRTDIDNLTGLLSRQGAIAKGLMVAKEGEKKAVPVDREMAVLDIDFFKKVNDKFGHDVGDDVLSKLGEIVQKHLGKDSELIRFGGEEVIAMKLDKSNKSAILDNIEAARQEFKEAVFADGKLKDLDFSAGYGKNFKIADEELFAAKEAGRGQTFIGGAKYAKEQLRATEADKQGTSVESIEEKVPAGEQAETKPKTTAEKIRSAREAAQARIQKQAEEGKLRSVVGPEGAKFLRDELIIGASYVAEGAVKFGDWVAKAKKALPHMDLKQLRRLFDKVKGPKGQDILNEEIAVAEPIEEKPVKVEEKVEEPPKPAKKPPVKKPGQKRTKFSETIEKRTPKKKFETFYTPRTVALTLDEAKTAVEADPDGALKAFREDRLRPDDVFAVGNELSEKAYREGREEESFEIDEQLTHKATRLGRGVKMFDAYGKYTPARMVKYAEKQIDKANKKYNRIDKLMGTKAELSKDDKKWIKDKMMEIKGMEEGAARDKIIKEVLERISSKIPLGVNEYFDLFRYNNMLSSPWSQYRNIFGNSQNAFFTRPFELGIEAGIDYVANVFNPNAKAREVYARDVKDYYKNALNALPQAWLSAKEAFKPTSKIMKPDLRQLRTANVPWQLKPFTIMFPKTMEAMDKFFNTTISAGEHARLRDRGVSEAEAGKRAFELAEAYLYREDTGKIDPNADAFSNALDYFSEMIKSIRKKPGLWKSFGWFVPFVTTPINIAKANIQRTPVPIASKLAGKAFGSEKKITRQEVAKLLAGQMFMGLGAIAAMMGHTTWIAPRDEEEKEAFYATNRRPFSFKVPSWVPGLGDKWLSMWMLGPYAMAYALPAAMKYYFQDSPEALTDSDIKKLGSTVLGANRFLMSQTPLSGVEGFYKVMSGELDYKVSKQMGWTVGQFMPFQGVVRNVSQMLDPVYRRTSGFEDSALKDFKKIKQGLYDRYDILSPADLDYYQEMTGEPAKRDFLSFVGPWPMGQYNEMYEDVYRMIQRDVQERTKERTRLKEEERIMRKLMK